MAEVTAALAAFGESLIGLTGTDTGEVRLGGVGSSSTMPQKQNPIGPSVLVALNAHMAGLRSSLQTAAVHQYQRDGAAWFTEWMVLPQIALSTAAALETARGVMEGLHPDEAQMHAHVDGLGLLHAEALSFALAAHMPRPEAQTATKALVAEAVATGKPLRILAEAAHRDLPDDLFDPSAQMGAAPDAARAFAIRVAHL